MVRCLRLALLFCCGCMLLLIFVFTWHQLKEKISGEQVPRGLLSCERLRELILIFSERKVVFVDGCWIKRPGETKVRLLRWWRWLKFIFEQQSRWSTILLMALQNISSSLPESYASSSRSGLWPVMFFISHFGNPKDFNFRTFFFLQSGFFLFVHNSTNGDFFSFCSILCLLCWTPWLDFYTKHQLDEHQYKGPIFRKSTGLWLLNNKKNGTRHLSVLFSYILGDIKSGLKSVPYF